MSRPSDTDVVSRAGRIGSPRPRPTLRSLGFTLPVLISTTVAVNILGYAQKLPCKQVYFADQPTFQRACYTDIYKLYFTRGLAQGKVPYLDKGQPPLEYPVLTGGFMQAMASLARWVHGTASGASRDAFGTLAGAGDVARSMAFYEYTVVGLSVCAVVMVVGSALVAGRQGTRVGLMIAASPVLLLSAFINWDLLAVMLAGLALLAWNKKWPVVSGLLFGLAIATKFYPVIFLGPLLILTLRTGKWREFLRLACAAAAAWLAVNLPIMIAAWSSWTVFYTFNQQRPVDWGSIFYPLVQNHTPVVGDPGRVNLLGTGLFVLSCLGIAVLALAVKRRPRLPQLMFLVLAAFLLTNKVWSPQYAIWLLPLIPLARPKLPAYLVWQVAETVYFFGIWSFLTNLVSGGAKGLTEDQYYLPLLVRFVSVLALVVLVIIDIVWTERDLVRRDGDDDPAGGVFDGAPDRFRLSAAGTGA